MKAARRADPSASEPTTSGLSQPVAAHEAPDEPEEARRGEREAGQVEGRTGAVGLLHTEARERQQDEADRDVQPEDPLPRDPLDDRTADHRAERDRQAADTAPGPEREPAPLRWDRGRQDRERQRQHDRAAEALQRPRTDQRTRAWGERRKGRGDREDRQADAEQPAAAEAIAERGAGQEQHGERQRVGVDGPLELFERRAEILADHRQGGGHDEVVERDHEERGRRDRPRPERPLLLAHRSSISCLVISHSLRREKREGYSCIPQPATSRFAHGSLDSVRPSAATTLQSIP